MLNNQVDGNWKEIFESEMNIEHIETCLKIPEINEFGELRMLTLDKH